MTTDRSSSTDDILLAPADSAAARAGIKVGDKIVSIDDKPTPNFSTVQHILGPKYEGDVIKIKVKRGDAEMAAALAEKR